MEPVCVRSGLYEVDVVNAECYPVYWNRECGRGTPLWQLGGHAQAPHGVPRYVGAVSECPPKR